MNLNNPINSITSSQPTITPSQSGAPVSSASSTIITNTSTVAGKALKRNADDLNSSRSSKRRKISPNQNFYDKILELEVKNLTISNETYLIVPSQQKDELRIRITDQINSTLPVDFDISENDFKFALNGLNPKKINKTLRQQYIFEIQWKSGEMRNFSINCEGYNTFFNNAQQYITPNSNSSPLYSTISTNTSIPSTSATSSISTSSSSVQVATTTQQLQQTQLAQLARILLQVQSLQPQSQTSPTQSITTIQNIPMTTTTTTTTTPALSIASTPKATLMTEFLEKRLAHERWADVHQYEQPQFWHNESKLDMHQLIAELFSSFEDVNLIVDKEDKIDPANLSRVIGTLHLEIKSGMLSPDYQIPLLLFQLRSKVTDANIKNAISKCILTCMKRMTIENKGEVARFAGLIDSEEGQTFRNEIYPFIFRWAEWCLSKKEMYNLDENNPHGWFSVQETIRRCISEANKIHTHGSEYFNHQRYKDRPLFAAALTDNALMGAAELSIQSFEQMLNQLSLGKEVTLPHYYHGFQGSENEGTFPADLLNGKLVQSTTSAFSGVFVSTSPALDYINHLFRVILFGPNIAFRKPWHILNNGFERTTNPTRQERWIGVRKTVPIALKQTDNQLTKTSHLAGLVVGRTIKQQNELEKSSCSNFRVLGIGQAMVEHNCLEFVRPTLIPIHLPCRIDTTREQYKNISCHPPIDHHLINNFHFKCMPLVPDELKNEYVNFPASACLKIMNGTYAPSFPAVEQISNPNAEQELEQLHQKRRAFFINCFATFPAILPPPPLRHVHRHLAAETPFGTVVGMNPIHAFKSISSQHMLFYWTNVLWKKQTKAQQNVLSSLLQDSTKTEHTLVNHFFSYLAYLIIKNSIPTRIDDTILTPYKFMDDQMYGLIDPDVFEMPAKNGVNGRHQPYEPGYVLMLLNNLTQREKTHLKMMMKDVDYSISNSMSWKRLSLIKTLLADMGVAIQSRYFLDPGRGLSNNCYNKIFQGINPNEILRCTNSLKADFNKVKRNEHLTFVQTGEMWNMVRLLRRPTQTQKDFWHALEHIDFPKVMTPFEALRKITRNKNLNMDSLNTLTLSNLSHMDPSANSIAYLAFASQNYPQEHKNFQDLESRTKELGDNLPRHEKGKLIRLISNIDGETGIRVRRFIYKILSLFPIEDNAKFPSTQEILVSAKNHVEQILANENVQEMDMSAHEEWLSHINARLNKISAGEEVFIPWGYSTTQSTSYPEILVHCAMGDICQIADTVIDQSGNISIDSNNIPPPIVFNASKSIYGRTAVAYILGPEADPDAHIPIWTSQASELEFQFLKVQNRGNLMKIIKPPARH